MDKIQAVYRVPSLLGTTGAWIFHRKCLKKTKTFKMEHTVKY